MENSKLAAMIEQGEGISLEFKRCGNKPGKDVFETMCAFANRQGGNLLLGVLDDGTIQGVPEGDLLSIERNIANISSDPSLFSSAPLLEFERLREGDLVVLRVWVPMGPAVYRFKGAVYDRVADADVRVSSDARINALYLRKQNLYTERRVLPWVGKDDLRVDLLERVRAMAAASRADHPWRTMDDDDLIRSARLKYRDPETGKEGFTLAAAMLLGSDDLIFDVAPAYRIDALLRRTDDDRYDDRLMVRTNLLDSYELLSEFCRKWLPDPFLLDGERRVSSRDVIVRELVSNLLIHREYSSPYTAQLVIDRAGISTRNASRSMFAGRLTPERFDPTPKNPIIADFFMQVGLAEELGSGTRNLFRISRLYTGEDPVLEDGDFFTAFVAFPDSFVRTQGQSAGLFEEKVARSLALAGSMTAAEIATLTGEAPRTVRRRLSAMVDAGVLVRIGGGRSTSYRLA